jgi:hypothetical protein
MLDEPSLLGVFYGSMLKSPSAPASGWFLSRGRLVGFLALALAALPAGTACEDKAIGRPCQLKDEITAVQGAYTVQASDCPSRICVKPNVQAGVSTDLDTVAYCTAQCSSDDDCGGQTRDSSNQNDKRCRKGFSCAPIFGKGKLCCTKLCLCRDFFSAAVGPAIPDECNGDAGVTCS